MKTKLTLSIDSRVIGRAKAVARRRGVSLSGLVETHFERLAATAGSASPSTAARWRGSLRTPHKAAAADDPRLAFLLDKHVR
ncbi:hypothetical protein OPIT5_06695 [Opitutaceae bacterium TAV5]|nr:hypothetical protein OPIT5_06695 [Opitutaceae bacterium TAV5]